MSNFARTAVTISNVKESALYFDYIIPVAAGIDNVTRYLEEYAARLQAGDNASKASDHALSSVAVPPTFLGNLLPPDLVNNRAFCGDLRRAIVNIGEAALRHSQNYIKTRDRQHIMDACLACGNITARLLRDYGLTSVPMAIDRALVSDDARPGVEHEIAVTLPMLNLIDASKASWEQILEFRRDREAQNKLRRLRLFAFENYAGKSISFIEMTSR